MVPAAHRLPLNLPPAERCGVPREGLFGVVFTVEWPLRFTVEACPVGFLAGCRLFEWKPVPTMPDFIVGPDANLRPLYQLLPPLLLQLWPPR